MNLRFIEKPRAHLLKPQIAMPGLSLLRNLQSRHVFVRIHRRPVHSNFEVQVGAGGEAGVADQGDALPALDPLAGLHQQLRGVGELGGDTVAVVDRDGVAVARFPAGIGHDTRGGGLDRTAHRRRHVDALVRPGDVEDRVLAHGRERAREPALGRHDRRRGGQLLRVAGQTVLGLLERRGQQVGPADQGVQVDPDLLGVPDRWPCVQQPRTGGQRGSADTGGLDLGIDGLEVGEDPDAGVAG